MKVIRARVSINSTPENVFRVLTDFDSYAQWNPWLLDVTGDAREGARVKVKPNLITFFGLRLCYRLVKIQSPDFMLWEEETWFRPLFHTTREYQVYTKAGGGAVYSMSLQFYGPLAPVVILLYRKAVRRGLARGAEGLKLYCENKYPLLPTDSSARRNAFNPKHSSPNLNGIKI